MHVPYGSRSGSFGRLIDSASTTVASFFTAGTRKPKILFFLNIFKNKINTLLALEIARTGESHDARQHTACWSFRARGATVEFRPGERASPELPSARTPSAHLVRETSDGRPTVTTMTADFTCFRTAFFKCNFQSGRRLIVRFYLYLLVFNSYYLLADTSGRYSVQKNYSTQNLHESNEFSVRTFLENLGIFFIQ